MGWRRMTPPIPEDREWTLIGSVSDVRILGAYRGCLTPAQKLASRKGSPRFRTGSPTAPPTGPRKVAPTKPRKAPQMSRASRVGSVPAAATEARWHSSRNGADLLGVGCPHLTTGARMFLSGTFRRHPRDPLLKRRRPYGGGWSRHSAERWRERVPVAPRAALRPSPLWGEPESDAGARLRRPSAPAAGPAR